MSPSVHWEHFGVLHSFYAYRIPAGILIILPGAGMTFMLPNFMDISCSNGDIGPPPQGMAAPVTPPLPSLRHVYPLSPPPFFWVLPVLTPAGWKSNSKLIHSFPTLAFLKSLLQRCLSAPNLGISSSSGSACRSGGSWWRSRRFVHQWHQNPISTQHSENTLVNILTLTMILRITVSSRGRYLYVISSSFCIRHLFPQENGGKYTKGAHVLKP